MKMVTEVLAKAKGEKMINETLTGKGAFSQTGFNELVSALCNDTTFKIPTYDKNGEKNGEVNLSALIRDDMKKTLEKAKYPQKSEAGVIDSCEIVANGIAKAIPYIVAEQMKSGKKFDFPNGKNYTGSIYLAETKAHSKTVDVRDMNTKEKIGISDISYKDCVQVKAKSPIPSWLTTKVRKDLDGKVVK